MCTAHRVKSTLHERRDIETHILCGRQRQRQLKSNVECKLIYI